MHCGTSTAILSDGVLTGVYMYNYVLVEVMKKMLIRCLRLVNIFISQCCCSLSEEAFKYLSEILQVNHFQLNGKKNYIQRVYIP